MRTTIIFLLMCSIVWAEPPINEKYSYKNFTNSVMTDAPVDEFNNTTIVGSCFYQEGIVNRHIFPEDMRGVYFKRCNLDNVYMPLGNIIETYGNEACSNKKILVQNDWEDWVVDDTLKPIEPINKEMRIEKGMNIETKNIPKNKFTRDEYESFKSNLIASVND